VLSKAASVCIGQGDDAAAVSDKGSSHCLCGPMPSGINPELSNGGAIKGLILLCSLLVGLSVVEPVLLLNLHSSLPIRALCIGLSCWASVCWAIVKLNIAITVQTNPGLLAACRGRELTRALGPLLWPVDVV
jgi:hypothetical protein